MGIRFDRENWVRAAFRGGVAFVIGLSAVLLGLTLLLPRLVSDDALRLAVLERASAALEQPVTAASARLDVWPRPVAVLEDVATGGAQVKRVEARLAIPALLAGRVEPVRLRLVEGTIALKATPTPGGAANALGRLTIGRVDFERIVLSIGSERIQLVDARLDHGSGAATARGEAEWRDENVQFDLRADGVADLAGRTGGSVFLAAGPVNLRYSGEYGLDGPGEGTLALEGPALGPALSWLGLPAGGTSLDAFSVKGRTGVTAWGWELEDATVALGEMRGEGVLGLVRGARRKVNGTLAFGKMDASLEALQKFAAGAGADLDADLRFSASEARLGLLRFEEVAAALRADADGVILELGDARYAGGRAVGALTLPRVPANGAVAEIRAFDATVTSLTLPLSDGSPRVTGRADIVAKIVLDGEASATARFEIREGTLEGLDLRAVARLGAGLATDAAREGKTPFDLFTGEAKLTGEMLELVDLKLSASGLAARLKGRIDLSRNVPALSGEVATVGMVTDASNDGGLSLAPEATAFFIGGSLAKPLVVPVEPR